MIVLQTTITNYHWTVTRANKQIFLNKYLILENISYNIRLSIYVTNGMSTESVTERLRNLVNCLIQNIIPGRLETLPTV